MKHVLLIIIAFGCIAVGLCGCNVTRKITTESSYFQRGDTACTIITRTIETYDATKK